jgi:adenylate kinase family enzyme
MEQTVPVIDHYRQRGVLIEIDGDQPVDAVERALHDALRAYRVK